MSTKTIPDFPMFMDFFEVNPKDYMSLVDKFEPYSDFNYVSVYTWNKPGECFVSVLNGNLVLSLKDYTSDKFVVSFIGGNQAVDTAKTLLGYVKNNTQYFSSLNYIPKCVAEILRQDASLKVIEDVNNHDYILSNEDAFTMEGVRFANKRKRLNKFKRSFEGRYRITDLDLSDRSVRTAVYALNNVWRTQGTEGANNKYTDREAINRLLNALDLLKANSRIACMGLEVDNKLAGYYIYEVLSSDYAVGHYAKSDINVQYAEEFLLSSVMNRLWADLGVRELNIEQDLGIPGLREHKMRHSPVRFLTKFEVSQP